MTDLDPRPFGDPGGRARATDPTTSHKAAESLDEQTLAGEQARVLNAVRSLCAEGLPATAGAVTRMLGDRQRNCVARRLTDLKSLGYVDKAGTYREDRTGARSEIVWVVL